MLKSYHSYTIINKSLPASKDEKKNIVFCTNYFLYNVDDKLLWFYTLEFRL